jgi:hypothetical protein
MQKEKVVVIKIYKKNCDMQTFYVYIDFFKYF